RLCQIVWRKLHGNFVAGYDPDEMLAHFARDMRKHIALARKIDTEHRARQDLSHSAFGDDLFFLRHRAPNIRTKLRGSRITHAYIDFSATGPAKSLASIHEAPVVSTTRRSAEARRPL